MEHIATHALRPRFHHPRGRISSNGCVHRGTAFSKDLLSRLGSPQRAAGCPSKVGDDYGTTIRATLGAEERTQAEETRKQTDNGHRVRQKTWTIAHWIVEGHYYKSVRLENAHKRVKQNDRHHRPSFSVCSPRDENQVPRPKQVFSSLLRFSLLYRCGGWDRRRSLLWKTLGAWAAIAADARQQAVGTLPSLKLPDSRPKNPSICSCKNTCLKCSFLMPYRRRFCRRLSVVWVDHFLRRDECAPGHPAKQQSKSRLQFIEIGWILTSIFWQIDYFKVISLW